METLEDKAEILALCLNAQATYVNPLFEIMREIPEFKNFAQKMFENHDPNTTDYSRFNCEWIGNIAYCLLQEDLPEEFRGKLTLLMQGYKKWMKEDRFTN